MVNIKDKSIYMIGGLQVESDRATDKVQRYDIEHNTVEDHPSLNHARNFPGCCASQDQQYIFAVCGIDRESTPYNVQRSIERRSVANRTDQWDLMSLKVPWHRYCIAVPINSHELLIYGQHGHENTKENPVFYRINHETAVVRAVAELSTDNRYTPIQRQFQKEGNNFCTLATY